MDGDDIRLLEQFVLRDSHVVQPRALVGQFWLQAFTLISKAAPFSHRAADVPKTQEPERPPSHVMTADRLLPSAVAQRRVLGNEIAGAGQDKRPGQFDRRRRGVARMNDLHASLSRSLEIDRGVPARRRGDRRGAGITWQGADDGRAGDRHALSHRADDIEDASASTTTLPESAR